MRKGCLNLFFVSLVLITSSAALSADNIFFSGLGLTQDFFTSAYSPQRDLAVSSLSVNIGIQTGDYDWGLLTDLNVLLPMWADQGHPGQYVPAVTFPGTEAQAFGVDALLGASYKFAVKSLYKGSAKIPASYGASSVAFGPHMTLLAGFGEIPYMIAMLGLAAEVRYYYFYNANTVLSAYLIVADDFLDILQYSPDQAIRNNVSFSVGVDVGVYNNLFFGTLHTNPPYDKRLSKDERARVQSAQNQNIYASQPDLVDQSKQGQISAPAAPAQSPDSVANRGDSL